MEFRTIKPTLQFRSDFERVKKEAGDHRLDTPLLGVIDRLAADLPLPAHCHDHPLSGIFEDCRDCHVGPELVLIYRKPDAHTLELIRLVHDVFRLMLARFATEKAVPFKPLVPAITTVEAIEEARRGGLKDFADSTALLKSLIAGD
ncbi:type II toxin-antitoxin system mRNA interferase toxin, RelE/StbE family [Hyphomicrobium album]|uniref:type II toxin-antitoxin system mRNA interferase toxin, RelE/StbE family n=1 Tax=Hyphomicrobium album TaxID=2665159 RepID=UPI001E2D9DED|nr:type II toxin-antitoxin system mRNA interferase toxin, RelE/StbE family [Hyphomicrobium album]